MWDCHALAMKFIYTTHHTQTPMALGVGNISENDNLITKKLILPTIRLDALILLKAR